MLPKILRLPSTEIPLVARRGRLIQLPGLDVRVLAFAADMIPTPQFAVSVSASLSKKATVRNRIKRKLHAAIIELNHDLTLPSQKFLLIVRSVELVEMEQEKLKQLLRGLFT